MNYDVYLFSNLIKLFNAEFEELPYDEQWDNLPSLYEEYDKSKFNVDTKGAYECMIEFLEEKYPRNIGGYNVKVLTKAQQYLCADDDDDLLNQFTNIVKNVNQDELIDYVDEVVVWSKVEFEFTCKEFLNEVGYIK
jgi:DNA-binding transcriptional regulator GbsR (MarR family)